MGIILITGGARSGKSSFAQQLAAAKSNILPAENKKVAYLATAIIGDAEMRRRVEIHRRSRPGEWITIEEPYHLCRALDQLPAAAGVVLVDCLTIWLTNLLFQRLEKEDGPHLKRGDWQKAEIPAAQEMAMAEEKALEKYLLGQVKRFIEKTGARPATCILVSNEVGLGVVPEHYLGRLFRDLAGMANQFIAAKAEQVYLVVAGIPLKIKG